MSFFGNFNNFNYGFNSRLFYRCGLCFKIFPTMEALSAHHYSGADFARLFIFFALRIQNLDDNIEYNINFYGEVEDDYNDYADDYNESLIHYGYEGDEGFESITNDEHDEHDDDNNNNNNDVGEEREVPVTLDLLREWEPIYASAPAGEPAPMDEDEGDNDIDLELRL